MGLLASLLSGCAVGPNFHQPSPPSNAAYVRGQLPKKTTATPGPGGAAQVFVRSSEVRKGWYHLFHNKQLNSLIKTALANSPSLKAGRARLRAAHEDLKAAEGGLYPQINASAGATRQRTTGTQIGINNPLFTNIFNLYQGQVSLSYHLDVFGRVRRKLENRKAQLNYQRYEELNTYLTLIDNIVATSLAEAGINATIQATQQIIAAQQGTVKLLKNQEKYGAADRSKVLQAQAQLAATQASLPPLQRQLAIAEDRLAVLVGKSPGTFRNPQLTLSDFSLPTRLPVTLPSTLVKRRPDVLAAQSLMHAASANIGVATAQMFPDFTLSASYGRDALSPAGLTDPMNAIWSFGAALLAPIFHGGALHAQRRAAVDLYQAAAADYQNTVLIAFGEVADSLRSLQADAQGLKARHKAMVAARDSLNLARQRYRAGATDYLSLYSAQQQYQQAVINYTQARLQRYQDTAGLYRALGGGWWNTKSLHNHTSDGGKT